MRQLISRNKIIIIFLICIMPTSLWGSGQDSSNRKEYFLFLKDEGFSPTLDNEGDIIFVIDQQQYYLLVYDEEPPLYVQIQNSGIKLEESEFSNPEIVLKVINTVNNHQRVAKLVVVDGILYCRAELLLQNAMSLRYIFYRSMKYVNESMLEFKSEYNKLVPKQEVENETINSFHENLIEV